MERFAHEYPHTLSAGEKQRVALARALITNPQILLMDEPLNYLDVYLKKEIIEILKNLRAQVGITIIYVTHLPDEALLLECRAGILERGKIEKIGKVEDIVKEFM